MANCGRPFLKATDLASPPRIFSTNFNTFSELKSSLISIYLILLPVLNTLTFNLLGSSTPIFCTQSLCTEELIQVTLKIKLDLFTSSSFFKSFNSLSVFSSISFGEKTMIQRTLSYPKQVSFALF